MISGYYNALWLTQRSFELFKIDFMAVRRLGQVSEPSKASSKCTIECAMWVYITVSNIKNPLLSSVTV